MPRNLVVLLFLTSSLSASQLPFVFERNVGQAAADVRFVSRAGTECIALLEGGSFRSDGIEVHLDGADVHAATSGVYLLPGRSNYFIGDDPRHWHTGIEQFAQVLYHNVYPGIDLAFHGREYDFLIAPHADPSRIRLEFRGAHPHLDSGDLVVPALRQQRPRAYQMIDSQRREVTADFVLAGSSARLRLGPYDRTKPLVIDPVIVFATYLGGSGEAVGASIAVDGAGNIYVAGSTTSADFPVTPGLPENGTPGAGGAFVTKLSPDGSAILYSTVMSNSRASGIVVDAAGNAYVTGTVSGSFPTTSGAYQGSPPAGFVVKLSPAGDQLLYSALITASPFAIAIDSSGAAYVAGAAGAGFVTTAGAFQTTASPGNCPQVNLHEPPPLCNNAFVLKLKPDGSALVYATYLGGLGPDQASSIAVDESGNAVVVGSTASTNFPVTSNAQQPAIGGAPPPVGPNDYGDGFVAKLNGAGSSLLYSTYLGGSGIDYANFVAIDPAGNLYISGSTSSSDFPVTPGALITTFPNAASSGSVTGALPTGFVAKMAPAGNLVYATYMTVGNVIGADQAGYVYLFDSASRTGLVYNNPAIDILNQSGSAFVSSGGSGVALSGSSPYILDGKGFIYDTGGVSPGYTFFTTPSVVQSYFDGSGGTACVVKIALANTPRMWISGAVNAATQLLGLPYGGILGSFAPGEIITIYGTLLGPNIGAAPAGGAVPSVLGGVKVLFDGIAAPLLYAQSNQINAIVPFEVHAPTTNMTIEYNGNSYGPMTVPVFNSIPGIFTVNGTGSGQAAILNQDGTLNSASNPAAKGSVISIYATGAGLMNSPMTDGAITPSTPPFPMPQLPVQVEIGGVPAVIEYAGAAPGLVAGAIQVNAYVPLAASSGASVPVVLNVGGYLSWVSSTAPGSATVAIQ